MSNSHNKKDCSCSKETNCCQINQCLKKYPCLPTCPSSDQTKVMICVDGKIFWVPRTCIVDPSCEQTLKCLCDAIEHTTECPENRVGQLSLIKTNDGHLQWIESRCLTECHIDQLQCCLEQLPELGQYTCKICWNLTQFFATFMMYPKPWKVTMIVLNSVDQTSAGYSNVTFGSIEELEQILEEQGWMKDSSEESDTVYCISLQSDTESECDSKVFVMASNQTVFCQELECECLLNECSELKLIYRVGEKKFALDGLDKIWECACLETCKTECPPDRPHVGIMPHSSLGPNASLSVGPRGTGFLSAQKPDGTLEGGNCRGRNAVDWQMIRNSSSQVAAGNYSVICGGRQNSTVSESSFIGGGFNNLTNGISSVVSGGSNNKALGTLSVIGGGESNTSSVSRSTVSGGSENVASGSASIVGGGQNNICRAELTGILGGKEASANVYGQQAHAAGSFDTNVKGDAQTSQYILRNTTEDANVKSLFLDGGSRRLVIPNNSTWTFDVLITARGGTIGTEIWAGFSVRGIVENNAGTVVIRGMTFLLDDNSGGLFFSVQADNPNDALDIRVYGLVGETIQWVAFVRTVETILERPLSDPVQEELVV